MPEFDLSQMDQQATYFLLTGLVVPRPIAWISTVSRDGTRNLAPHSFFNVVSLAPAMVQFVSTGEKDTLSNVRQTREFVVNVVTADVLEAMNVTATDFPSGEDEFTWAQLESAPSGRVSPPRVVVSPCALECRVTDILAFGSGSMVVGEVLHAHIDDALWVGGRIDTAALQPVGRLSGADYAIDHRVVRIPRQSWDDEKNRPVATD